MKLIIRVFIALIALSLLSASVPECIDGDGPYINGYCDHWGNHVPGYINNDSWMLGMPPHVSGKMVFYGIYSMEATAEYRGIDYEEYGCPMGGISLMSPLDIGKLAYVKVDNEWYGPFCVVDCAKRGDMYSIVVYRDEVAEVNFGFAEQMGMVERRGNSYMVNEWYKDVEVYLPPVHYSRLEYPSSEPVDFSAYWLERVEFINKWEPTVRQVEHGWIVKGTDIYYEAYKNYNEFGIDNKGMLFYLE